MKILIVSDVLLPGGAEAFSLRLAQELYSKGNDVSYFVLRENKINREFKRTLAPQVPLVTIPIPFIRLIEKIDGFLFSTGINFSLLRSFFIRGFRNWVKKNKPDIIHSNLFSADLVVTKAIGQGTVPIVTTIHGDYLRYADADTSIRAIRVRNFGNSFYEVLKRISAIICITDKQMEFVKNNLARFEISAAYKKIYNGFRLPGNERKIPRSELNIPENAFVIGMVARGIREKGWEELILAFLDLDISHLYLLLVGGGEFLDNIKKKYNNPRIIYTGSVVNPIDYIRLFDVGCLPSYSENLPTSVVEYLFCNKPVIASDTGEIRNMLKVGTEKECGVLIRLENKRPVVRDIREKILELLNDPVLLESFRANTNYASKNFEMNTCIASYEDVYSRCISKTL